MCPPYRLGKHLYDVHLCLTELIDFMASLIVPTHLDFGLVDSTYSQIIQTSTQTNARSIITMWFLL